MLEKRYRKSKIFTFAAFTVLCLSLAASAWGRGFPGSPEKFLGANNSHRFPISKTPRREPPAGQDTLGRLRYWHETMLDANALDHTPVAPGETRVYGEQLGPCRTSRAFAIVHIAIFEAVNAIVGGHKSYTGFAPSEAAPPPASALDAAIAQAAHDTLAALYPSQAAAFDALLAEDLAKIPDGSAETMGINLGRQAAAEILAARADDGSENKDPVMGIDYISHPEPYYWHQDPISKSPIAMGAYWDEVKPFVMSSSGQFRAPPPPYLDDPDFWSALDEVMRLGGDGDITPTERTDEETMIGIYWSYDGTPGLGTPLRLYNQIAVHIAREQGSDAVELARLLYTVNVAMADAGIAAWDTKYYYEFARPITCIRDLIDPTWTPLGSPASNLIKPNFTPPFPAYTAGHSVFGAALFSILRKFYGTDHITFTFISDELNGVTKDNKGEVRPLVPRTFKSLSQAMEENSQSRIFLGIHWSFDATEGETQGQRIADYVFNKLSEPGSASKNGRKGGPKANQRGFAGGLKKMKGFEVRTPAELK